jgi:hypothetical protein
VSEKYELIDEEKDAMTAVGEKKYTITVMCEWLEVSTAGYYEWRDRPVSATSRRRDWVTLLISGRSTTPTRPTATGGSTPSSRAGVCGAASSWSARSCVSWAWCRASRGRGGTA